jgi:peptide chain release factor 1
VAIGGDFASFAVFFVTPPSGFAMREMLDAKLARFEELERAMTDPGVLADQAKMAAVAREHGSLVKFASTYRRFLKTNREIVELRQMAKSEDSEERELARGE